MKTMKGPGLFRLLDQGHECKVERDTAGNYHFTIPAEALPPPPKGRPDYPPEALVSFTLPLGGVVHRVVTLLPAGKGGSWTVHDSNETVPVGLLSKPE
jgi:hypothetical protein